MPKSAAWRWNAAGVEGVGQGTKRGSARNRDDLMPLLEVFDDPAADGSTRTMTTILTIATVLDCGDRAALSRGMGAVALFRDDRKSPGLVLFVAHFKAKVEVRSQPVFSGPNPC